MLIFDKPYISDFLLRTANSLGLPVFNHGISHDSITNDYVKLMDEKEFLGRARAQTPLKLYCNSENSINWITNNLADTNIPNYIEFCKNKVGFREKIKPLYPDFNFQEVDFSNIRDIDVTSIKKPFIIKPSVGFFSIGVYRVNRDDEWKDIVERLVREIELAEGLYPREVMNSTKFILEECIDGDEFAIDAYYNTVGKPVILSIMKHPFSSDVDVSDRVYYTSKEIILENLERLEATLDGIGKIAGFSNFPVHVEVRIDSNGYVIPIEFNPVRFAGWCVTDLAYYAYGINTYEYYFNSAEPDWSELLLDKEGKLYSMVLVDVPGGLKVENIKSFDYTALLSKFRKVLEFRKIDYHQYPVFAFLFIESIASSNELETVLKMDFGTFVS